MYGSTLYPYDPEATLRIDRGIPISRGCSGHQYLSLLKGELSDLLTNGGRFDFAIYNAGTDPFREDTLGGMDLSFDDIVERDRWTIKTLRSYNIPTLMLPSGGYSTKSYLLVAAGLKSALQVFT